MPKKYEDQSTVFIERNVISSLIEGITITPSMEERLRVLAYSIKSRSLLLKVSDGKTLYKSEDVSGKKV